MQRPRSTQPTSHDVNYGDLQRISVPSSSSASTIAGRQGPVSSSQASGFFEDYRSDQFGDFGTHHYGGSTSAHNRASSLSGDLDDGRYLSGEPHVRVGHASNSYGHSQGHIQAYNGVRHGYYNGFEDETVPIIDSSSAPAGISGFETDFELDLAASQLNAALSGSLGTSGTAAFPDSLGQETTEMMDIASSSADLANVASFQFPELPASLLDQGPEYEYVSISVKRRTSLAIHKT